MKHNLKTIIQNLRPRLAVLALLGAGGGLGQSALAQSTYTWNGGSGTSGNWNDVANWGGSLPASPQNYLNFTNTTRVNNTNNFAAGSGGFQIYFKAGSASGPFNLFGNSITFYDFSTVDPNIQNEGTVNTQTINFPIVNGNTHGANGILNINLNSTPAQGSLVFNGTISNADATVAIRALNVNGGNVTFNGALSDFSSSGKLALTVLGGTTTLTASNTYSGASTINAGTLTVGGAGLLGSGVYAGAIAIASGATLEYSSTNSAGQTLSGAITGAGALLFDSTNTTTLTLSGTGNNYSGTTTITNVLNASVRLSAGTANISPNTAFNILGNATSGGQLNITSSGTVANNITISGVGYVDGPSGKTQSDGALLLANSVTLSGTITTLAYGTSGLSQIEANPSGTSTYTETISGQITGSGGLNFFGLYGSLTGTDTGGNVIFNLANTGTPNNYVGNTEIYNTYTANAGSGGPNNTTLKLGASEQIPNGPGYGILLLGGWNPANANRSCTFELNSYNETVNGISTPVAGPLDNFIQNTTSGASILTVGDGNTNSTYGGTIKDGGTGKTLALTKIGTGTLTLTGVGAYIGNTTVNNGILSLSGTNTGSSVVVASSGVFSETSSGVIAGTGTTFTQGSTGASTLAGANTYSGATTVTGGTLTLSGAGAINSSSGITINGSGATLLQTSTTAVTPTVTLTQGTLTGSKTVNTVNVGAGTGGIISNNNGTPGASLTIGALTFNGAATVNTFSASTTAPIVTTTLSDNAAGTVTINPSAASWTTGTTYNLISYTGSIGGPGFGQFALGTVTGLSARQVAVLGNSGTAITLTINGDTPYWKGDGDGNWNTTSANNWKLVTSGTYTTFLANDAVLFNDNATAAGPIAVNINAANVNPITTTFNNNSKNYVLTSTGGYGISSGTLTLGGSGTVTIDAANTYTGGTVISSGTLQLGDGTSGHDGTLAGSPTVSDNGALVYDIYGSASYGGVISGGGTVAMTGRGTQTLTATNTYSGPTTIGLGTLTIGGAGQLGGGSYVTNIVNNGTLNYNSSAAQTLSGVVSGSGLLNYLGTGQLNLNGTNTYSGGTTLANGVIVPGNGSAFGSGTVTMNAGAVAYPVASMTITNPLFLNAAYLRLGGNNNPLTWSGPVTVTNGFSMSADNSGDPQTLSGSINFLGTGGISITNGGNNGATQGGQGDMLSGTISGSGGITYYVNGGNSRLTVTGANTYSGNTIVNGTSNGKMNVNAGLNPFSTGTVTLNAGAVIGSYPGSAIITNALTLNGGILEGESQYNNYNRLTWAGPITLTANSTLFQFGQNSGQMSQGVNVAGPLNMNGYTLTNSGNSGLYSGSVISGPISGTGNILQTVNILYLSATNTFSGTFRAVGGNITVQNTNAMQSATLDMNAADSGSVTLMNGAIIGALTGSRSLNLSGFSLLIGNNNNNTTYTGALTNTGSITKVGTGTLTLFGTNTYNGYTTISAGTLALSGNGSLTGSAGITVANNALFDVSGLSSTFALGSQTLSNSAPGAIIGGSVNSGPGTIALVYDGVNPSFIVTNGTLTLSASTIITVNNTGATLTPGTYKIISKSVGGVVGGSVPISVAVVNGPTAGTPYLSIVGGELYLTVGGTSSIGYSGSSFIYNGLSQSPTIIFGGSTATPMTTYVGSSVGYGPSVNAPTNAGTYYVSNTVAADANYFGTANSRAFTINTAAASVTANPKTKNYGDVNPTLTATVIGQVVGGDTINYTLATDAAQFSAAGVSNITVTLGSNPNYSLLTTNSTLTINPANTLVGASSANNPSGYKDGVAFLATLPPDATGTVVFFATNILDSSYEPFSTNTVSGVTTTSLSIITLPRGTNLITIAYLGDNNYIGSTNTLSQVVTNHPPVANNVSIARNAAVNSLKILVSDLLTNATDVDGDTLTLDSVGATTNGATILVAAGYVLYCDTNAVVDQFSYTVTDGYGGTNMATVTVTIDTTPLFGQSQIVSSTGSTATLNFAGIPGLSYTVSRSTDLTTWSSIWTTNAPTGGLFQFIDTSAPSPSAYYRLQYNP